MPKEECFQLYVKKQIKLKVFMENTKSLLVRKMASQSFWKPSKLIVNERELDRNLKKYRKSDIFFDTSRQKLS